MKQSQILNLIKKKERQDKKLEFKITISLSGLQFSEKKLVK